MSEGPNTSPTPSPGTTAPAAQPPAGPTTGARTKDRPRGVFASIGAFFAILFKPIAWVVRPLVFRVGHDKGNPKVYFTSFSTLIYLWPIMVMGWIGPLIVGHWVFTEEVVGWLWITVTLLVIICIGSDTDRNKTLALMAIIIILWLAGVLIEAKQGIPVLSRIKAYFESYDVRFDRGTAGVFSIATLIIMLFAIVVAWFDGRYEITTREITHKRIFRTSDSLPRAAKRIKRDWRDLIEVVLGIGAGDVKVIDSNSTEVMRIPNVPFLWFFRHDVDHILEVLATTEVEADEAAIIETEDAA